MELLIPLQFGNVLDTAIDGNFSRVLQIILMIVVLFLTMTVVDYLRAWLDTYITNDVSKSMKNYIVFQILNFPAEKIDEYKNGELLSRFEDVDKIVSFLLTVLNNIILNCCIIFFLAGILLKISIPLAVFHFLSVPFLMIISSRYSKKAKMLEKEIIQDRDKHYSFLFGLIQGNREVKSLGMIKSVKNVFENNHDHFVAKQIYRGKMSALWEGGYSLLAVFFQVIILLISCGQIILGKLTVGMYYSFNSYASRFSVLVKELIMLQSQFMVIIVSVDKILPFLKGNCDGTGNSKKCLNMPIHCIEVRNLKFNYKNMEEEVLKGINFLFCSSSFQLIVGHNGSGKSTLLNLLMDYYKPNEGCILVNGIDIKELETESLYKKIVYIRQKPFFFNMSIIDNFKLVNEQINYDEVVKVCQMVRMHEYIMSLPKQYNTELGECGDHFSGGQIQCLAIARGLILDADVYLLDEVTSDLDGENGQHIMELLRSIGKIIILVTHRLSEVKPSDNILVLEHGEIIAEGKHDELIKSCEAYRKLSGTEEKSSPHLEIDKTHVGFAGL